MKHRWQTIEVWLSTNAPSVLRNLNPPATPAEIVSLEQAMGVHLPPSVREAYTIHDGESPASDGLFGMWRLLPLAQVKQVSDELARLSRDYGFEDFAADLIPLLESSGDYLCTTSSPSGNEAPLVVWRHERPTHKLIAASLAAFFDAFIDRLRRGGYV